ncbi:hypothetical protein BDZ45DRAFT_747421 [Acephala macrosclerotiorum]|nr:hypothetical protein BDZ45DRAFT_747421 [Acephala macrosclerotiorum]
MPEVSTCIAWQKGVAKISWDISPTSAYSTRIVLETFDPQLCKIISTRLAKMPFDTFTVFLKLPIELRIVFWQRLSPNGDYQGLLHAKIDLDVPAMLIVYRESRFFAESFYKPKLKIVRIGKPIRFNYDTDIFCMKHERDITAFCSFYGTRVETLAGEGELMECKKKLGELGTVGPPENLRPSSFRGYGGMQTYVKFEIMEMLGKGWSEKYGTDAAMLEVTFKSGQDSYAGIEHKLLPFAAKPVVNEKSTSFSRMFHRVGAPARPRVIRTQLLSCSSAHTSNLVTRSTKYGPFSVIVQISLGKLSLSRSGYLKISGKHAHDQQGNSHCTARSRRHPLRPQINTNNPILLGVRKESRDIATRHYGLELPILGRVKDIRID